MPDLTITQKVGIILIVIGTFVFLAVGLVPDVQADSPYSNSPVSCGSATTVFLTDTNPGVAHECNGAAAKQVVTGVLAGGFWALIGGCLVVLFPKGARHGQPQPEPV